jgi:hypothetical protein
MGEFCQTKDGICKIDIKWADNNINWHVITCSDLVKRGGKDVVTVEIFRETYNLMKLVAEKKRWNTKEYINSVLKESIDREKFLQAYAPFLLKVGYEGNILFIKDSKIGKTAEICLREQVLYCNLCESKDCIHIHYSLALPEITKLYLKRPSR